MAIGVKEKAEMGRVVTEITVENMSDLYDAKRGMIPDNKVRKLTISNAVVDTGAAFFSLPARIIRDLGLSKAYTKRAPTSRGPADADVYSAVWLTIQGRSCTLDVMEVP